MHEAAGWHPAPAHGWTLPLWYATSGGALDEQVAARSGAVIFDRSHLGRFYVTGERAAEALARALATDARRLPVGRVARAVACRADGSVLDLPWLWPLEEGRWLVVGGPRARERLLSRVTAATASTGVSDEVALYDRLAATVFLSVQGPRAAELLAEVVGPTIPEALAPGVCRELLLGGYRAAAARASDVGEDGYWLLASPEVGEQLWGSALAAGAVPAGLAAHDALRLEAGVLEAPLETPSPATPAAACLEALVDLDAPDGDPPRGLARDFPGRDALLAERAGSGPERRATALRLSGREPARVGTPVLADGAPVGACVAAAYSAALGAPIALAYLSASALGAALAVEAGGARPPRRCRCRSCGRTASERARTDLARRRGYPRCWSRISWSSCRERTWNSTRRALCSPSRVAPRASAKR